MVKTENKKIEEKKEIINLDTKQSFNSEQQQPAQKNKKRKRKNKIQTNVNNAQISADADKKVDIVKKKEDIEQPKKIKADEIISFDNDSDSDKKSKDSDLFDDDYRRDK